MSIGDFSLSLKIYHFNSKTDSIADDIAFVLDEAAALKKLAIDYMHPEIGVTATDATAFGRNYFNRASAPYTHPEFIGIPVTMIPATAQ